jgi:hypothetical protein
LATSLERARARLFESPSSFVCANLCLKLKGDALIVGRAAGIFFDLDSFVSFVQSGDFLFGSLARGLGSRQQTGKFLTRLAKVGQFRV